MDNSKPAGQLSPLPVAAVEAAWAAFAASSAFAAWVFTCALSASISRWSSSIFLSSSSLLAARVAGGKPMAPNATASATPLPSARKRNCGRSCLFPFCVTDMYFSSCWVVDGLQRRNGRDIDDEARRSGKSRCKTCASAH
jgi:hypothetical protein